MKSLKPTLLIAMLSGIFQALVVTSIMTAIIKQDQTFIILAIFPLMASVLFMLKSHDYAVELRNWIDPTKELELLQNIPQDAIDRQWIKEIEIVYNDYIPDYSYDQLEAAKVSMSKQAKDVKIRTLISAAKEARGLRMNKRITITRSDD